MDAMIPCSGLPLGVVLVPSVVETRYAPAPRIVFMIAESSARLRARRSILCTITKSTGRSWMYSSIRCSSGRCSDLPERPPSIRLPLRRDRQPLRL